jgi:Protein of unknown function (DUF2971)
MPAPFPLVSDDERSQVEDFCGARGKRFVSVPVGPLFHYTTGENFINIMRSGQLWSTQIGCLNDTTEFHFAVDAFRSILDEQRGSLVYVPPLVNKLDELLAAPGVEAAAVFVTCFSEVEDDLSQWRAYSGGEGGFSIKFDGDKLWHTAVPNGIALYRVRYSEAELTDFIKDALSLCEDLFLKRCRSADDDAWLKDFAKYVLERLLLFAPLVKHPAFAAEREWRLIKLRSDPALDTLEFRARHSFISRHLPLKRLCATAASTPQSCVATRATSSGEGKLTSRSKAPARVSTAAASSVARTMSPSAPAAIRARSIPTRSPRTPSPIPPR